MLAVLAYQRDAEGGDEFEDHLVLGEFGVHPGPRLKSLISTCEALAQFWNFQSVAHVGARFRPGRTFARQAKKLKSVIRLPRVDALYVCRNWQLFNELLLAAYTDAEAICYGDGFGWLDLNDTKVQPRPLNPEGFAAIDTAYLFTPVEADAAGRSFALVPRLIQPPINYLSDTIRNIAQGLPDLLPYCSSLATLAPNGFSLIVGSNYSEFGCMRESHAGELNNVWARGQWALDRFLSVVDKVLLRCSHKLLTPLGFVPSTFRRKAEAEVAMYLHEVRRHCTPEDFLLIKPHPRECWGQSGRLAKCLQASGHKALVIDQRFRNIPLELLLCRLPITKAICMQSSTSLTLPLLTDITPGALFPCVSADTAKRFLYETCVPTATRRRVYETLIAQAFRREFSPLRQVDCVEPWEVKTAASESACGQRDADLEDQP